MPREIFRGSEQVQRELREIGRTKGKKIFRKVLKAGAVALRDEVREAAPMGATGTLKKSISIVKLPEKGRKNITYRVGPTTGRNAKHDAWYAMFVEFGTKPHKIAVEKKPLLVTKEGIILGVEVMHPGIAGRGFMRRAFDNNKRQVLGEMSGDFLDQLAAEIIRVRGS